MDYDGQFLNVLDLIGQTSGHAYEIYPKKKFITIILNGARLKMSLSLRYHLIS